jgi:hypothetical protein
VVVVPGLRQLAVVVVVVAVQLQQALLRKGGCWTWPPSAA